MPAAAVVVGTVAAGAIGASAQSKAAGKAADAQLTASREATALQREQYYDTRNLMQPTAIAGADARARQMLMQGSTPEQVRAFLQQTQGAWAGGPGGAAQNNPASMDELQSRYASLYRDWQRGDRQGGVRYDNFIDYLNATPGVSTQSLTPPQQPQQGSANDPFNWVDSWSYESSSPSYQFRLGEGQQALERSQAARGRLFSGATGMALQRYGQGFASQEFENDFRRLGALSGAGDQAQGITVNAGQNYANQAGANTIAGGNARASGYLAQGNAQANFWGNTVPGALGTWAGGGWK